MVKIGIISLYCNNPNYGGLLQAYALCKALRKLGYDCKQICFNSRPKKSKISREFDILKTKINHPLKKVFYGKWYNDFCKGKQLLKEFELSIPHTKVVNSETISELNKDFDAFICGSDQVWNPSWWRDTYFLSFAESSKKKIAYAASMARNQLTSAEADYALRMMRGFSAISLREIESVKALINFNPSFDAQVMPDPTLLLTADEWNQIICETVVRKPYIFAYFLGDNNIEKNAAIAYAKSVGKNIVFINSLIPDNKKWETDHQDIIISDIGVPEFLSLIQHADLVITDSFHGTVFSSIFNVPFLTINRSKNDSKKSMNSRITTLMNILGIQRNIDIIECGKDYSFTLEEKKLMNRALEKQRSRGIAFLSDSLGDI